MEKFVKFFILVYVSFQLLYGLGLADDDEYRKWKECKIPPFVAGFAWNQTLKATGGYYFPISSTSDFTIERKMLGGSINAAHCTRMKWSDDFVTVNIFYGVDRDQAKTHEAYFKCTQVDPPSNTWDCKHLKSSHEKEDLSHTAWITLTDNFTYSFTVRCFHNIKEQGWVLFSTSKRLPTCLTEKILAHARQLGYGTIEGKDYMIRDYYECGSQFCVS